MCNKLKVFPMLLIIIFSILGSIFFSQTVSAKSPKLSIKPEYYGFGYKKEGEIDHTTFSIWNSGGCSCGTLIYDLSESCDWIDISPTSGSSTGEHDTITINLDTSGLPLGYHSCDILISSNAGNKTFTVIVYIISNTNNPPNKPIINGPSDVKPDITYTYSFFSIEPDGDFISYYINWDDGTTTDWTNYQTSRIPYSEDHKWTPQGTYTIKVKAKDKYDSKSEWSDPYTINVSKSKQYIHPHFYRFLEHNPFLFQILQKLLRLIK